MNLRYPLLSVTLQSLCIQRSQHTLSSQDIQYLDQGVHAYGAVRCGLYCINTGDCVKYTQGDQVRQT